MLGIKPCPPFGVKYTYSSSVPFQILAFVSNGANIHQSLQHAYMAERNKDLRTLPPVTKLYDLYITSA